MSTQPVITAFDWVPDFAKGHVRDLRVRWALEEVGQPYDVRYLSQGEQKQPAHRALQPYGQVPTYEGDDVALFESGAIVLHIAETHDGLLPQDQAGRSRAMEWAIAALNSVEPFVMDWSMATLFEADKPWSAQRLPAIEERIRHRLADTARRLGDREWYHGAFSAGDLLMIAVLRSLEGNPLLEEQPALTAYVARGTARPAFARAMDGQMAGFTGAPPVAFAARPQPQGQPA
jgi:glutathione S-transferase